MDEVCVQALRRVTAWQAGLDRVTSWVFLLILMTGFTVPFLAFSLFLAAVVIRI